MGTPALRRRGQDHARPAGRSALGGDRVERGEDLAEVVTVDLVDGPSEPGEHGCQIHVAHRLAPVEAIALAPRPAVLLQSVEVDDGGEVVQPEARRRQHGLPLTAGAAGRTFVAFDADIAERVLAADDVDRPVFTAKTLHRTDELRRDVDESRRRGYVLSDEDVTDGIGAVGVPILRDGQLVGAVSVAGLIETVRRDQESLARRTRQAADRLARQGA